MLKKPRSCAFAPWEKEIWKKRNFCVSRPPLYTSFTPKEGIELIYAPITFFSHHAKPIALVSVDVVSPKTRGSKICLRGSNISPNRGTKRDKDVAPIQIITNLLLKSEARLYALFFGIVFTWSKDSRAFSGGHWVVGFHFSQFGRHADISPPVSSQRELINIFYLAEATFDLPVVGVPLECCRVLGSLLITDLTGGFWLHLWLRSGFIVYYGLFLKFPKFIFLCFVYKKGNQLTLFNSAPPAGLIGIGRFSLFQGKKTKNANIIM